MATTLDLDEILGSSERMEVKCGGNVVYTLRTDVSSRILLAAFSIRTVAQRLAKAPENPDDDEALALAEAAVDGYYADVHKVCLRIIQHTLPDETSEELYQKLTEEAQEQVVKAFFIRRSRASNLQQNATDETSNGSEPTTTDNRASRRAKVHKAR